MMETEGASPVAEGREFIGRVVLANGMMVAGGGEVLAHCEDIDACRAKVACDLHDLVFGFSEAEHDARLRQHAVEALVGCPSQDIERALILRHWPHLQIEARHSLDVVRKHL